VARPGKTCVIEIVKEKLASNPRIGGLYAPIMRALPVAMYESYLVPESCDGVGDSFEGAGACHDDQMQYAEQWQQQKLKSWDGRWRRDFESKMRDDDVYVYAEAFEKFVGKFIKDCRLEVENLDEVVVRRLGKKI
jgi:hypothetical protein